MTPSTMRVVHQFLRGKDGSAAGGQDRLIIGQHVLGVADGATAKPWDDPDGPDGAVLADAVASLLAKLDESATAIAAVRAATELVAGMLGTAGIAPGAGSAVVYALVHGPRREIWRIGDGHVLVNGERLPERETGESVVARARALVLRERLAGGSEVAALRAEDPGRRAIEPLLASLVKLRNATVPGLGYPAVDGNPVSAGFVEVFGLPAGACDVVLTSDGYFDVTDDLAETERLLARRLAADPLLVGEPPATKGCRPGAESFDDRSYLRVRVPPADGAGGCSGG
jgi:glycerophosphoryl diester phosphodiesterase